MWRCLPLSPRVYASHQFSTPALFTLIDQGRGICEAVSNWCTVLAQLSITLVGSDYLDELIKDAATTDLSVS